MGWHPHRVTLAAVAVLTATANIKLCEAAAGGAVNPININPINQIPGLEFLGGDKETEVQDRWWFWLIIGVLSAFFVVILAFGIRGYMKYKQHKKLQHTTSTIASLDGSTTPNNIGTTTTVTRVNGTTNGISTGIPIADIELGKYGTDVQALKLQRVETTKISRANSADF